MTKLPKSNFLITVLIITTTTITTTTSTTTTSTTTTSTTATSSTTTNSATTSTTTTATTNTSDKEFNDANYIYKDPGYSYEYLQHTTQDYFTNVNSPMDCAWISLNNQSEFFSYNNVSKVCKNFSPKNIVTVRKVQDKNQFAYCRRTKWIKAYAVSMGTGSVVDYSFLNRGQPSTWKVKDNPGFFRHPILDIWQQLPIEEVKFIIYKNQKPVVTLVFDGRNSTISSWFTKLRLKSSPWTNVLESNTHFRMDGNKWDFEIYYRWSGCKTGAGWLAIVKAPYCDWDNAPPYPYIYYTEKQKIVFSERTAKRADSMAIFLRLR